MAQPNKPSAKQSNPKAKDKKPPVYSSVKKEATTLLGSLDKWVDKSSKGLLIVIFTLAGLFSLLLFQARMDIGGDDSTYVLRAYDFVHKGSFPGFQGPLYPMFLSIFVSFLGINVIFLKSLSVICNIIALIFLYKAFKGRVPSFVLYSVLFITAINTFTLTYASLTYSEAFFMALQFVFFFYFFKLVDRIKNNNNLPLKESWKSWLVVGLMIFAMASARTVGIFTVGALMAYFIVQRQYRYIFYVLAVFLVFYIPVNFLEKILWHAPSQFGQQSAQYMQKNAYNAADGTENFHGFILRFLKNTNLFLSERFFQIIGLRSSDDSNRGLTISFILVFIFCFYRVIRSKNIYLLAASFYVLSLTGVTFLVMQIDWHQQPRLIMVFVPLYMMIFIYGLYDTFKKAPWALQMISVILVMILILTGFASTFSKSKENMPLLSKNLHGDIYYGFTPGWANYLKLSNWCESLPKDSLVACRKGPMSSVYANGREFFNVTKTDNINIGNADSVISFLKRNNVRYILLANINMGNTMERLIYPVAKTAPQKLKLLRQEGSDDDAARLYQVLY